MKLYTFEEKSMSFMFTNKKFEGIFKMQKIYLSN